MHNIFIWYIIIIKCRLKLCLKYFQYQTKEHKAFSRKKAVSQKNKDFRVEGSWIIKWIPWNFAKFLNVEIDYNSEYKKDYSIIYQYGSSICLRNLLENISFTRIEFIDLINISIRTNDYNKEIKIGENIISPLSECL
jgi:hypothetical protein